MRSYESRAVGMPGSRVRRFAMLLAGSALAFAFTLTAGPADTPNALQQHAAKLETLTPLQQQQFGQRLAAWNALPRAEREERRARYLAWMNLQPGERAQLRVLAAQVAAFPPERTQALRAQFDALEEVQRRGWRLGPSLGRDYAALFPLLAYVPESQQQPLLVRLRGLDDPQRADLGRLVQRTPPQERPALREALLKVPSAEVAGWLQHKLDQ